MKTPQMTSQKNIPIMLPLLWTAMGVGQVSVGCRVARGHRVGVQSVRQLNMEYLKNTQVKTLTLYAFSTENWNRSELEINFLMGLVKNLYFAGFRKTS